MVRLKPSFVFVYYVYALIEYLVIYSLLGTCLFVGFWLYDSSDYFEYIVYFGLCVVIQLIYLASKLNYFTEYLIDDNFIEIVCLRKKNIIYLDSIISVQIEKICLLDVYNVKISINSEKEYKIFMLTEIQLELLKNYLPTATSIEKK